MSIMSQESRSSPHDRRGGGGSGGECEWASHIIHPQPISTRHEKVLFRQLVSVSTITSTPAGYQHSPSPMNTRRRGRGCRNDHTLPVPSTAKGLASGTARLVESSQTTCPIAERSNAVKLLQRFGILISYGVLGGRVTRSTHRLDA